MRQPETKLGLLRSRLITIPAAAVVTAALVTVSVISALFAPAGQWQRTLYRLWASAVLTIFGAKVRVEGIDRLDKSANYVIVANHLSLVDVPVIMKSLPVDFKFLAKRELLRVPFIGWYLKRAGHLTVERGNLRSSIEGMNECARLIHDRRLSVLVFPEGTRSPDGKARQFRDGAAYLCIQAGVAAAPVALCGTWDILPAKSSYIMPGEVEVRIGAPVDSSNFSLRDRAALTAVLEDRVRGLQSAEPTGSGFPASN